MLRRLAMKTKSLSHMSSLACVAHCLLAPLVIVVFPLLGAAFDNMAIEYSILGVSVLCGIGIIYSGFCKHKKTHSLLLFGLGAALWILNAIINHAAHSHEAIPVMLLIGTTFVLAAYYMNHRDLSCCPSACCDHTHT